jgi:hypothetical protein
MAYDTIRRTVVLFGGAAALPAGGAIWKDDTWERQGDDWKQRPVQGPWDRQDHAMIYDSARRVTLLFGGATSVRSGDSWWLGAPLCAADFNGDGAVDDADFSEFAAAYDAVECVSPPTPVGCPADLNADQLVNDADFQHFAVAYDLRTCP